MKLHLPKGLMVAVMACIAAVGSTAWSATSSTTTYSDGVTYNGNIWTWNNAGNATAMSSNSSVYTQYSDPSVTYTGSQAAPGVSMFYFYFYGAETANTGNTLRFDGHDGNIQLRSDYSNVILGGIITGAGNTGTYTYGRTGNDASNIYLNGGHDVNMNIGSNFTLLANAGTGKGYIEVQKSGSWNVADAATLTLTAANGIKINANQTVNLSGEGTTVFSNKLALAGNLTNGADSTVNISTLSLEGGTLANNGTMNLNNAVISATDAALSNKRMTDYTGTISTTGGFATGTINAIANGESATLSGTGTLTYGGQTYTIDSDHTSVDVINYATYTLNSGKVDMGAAAALAAQAGASAPTKLILETTDAKEVDLNGLTTALAVEAHGGEATVTNADNSAVDIKLTHSSAKVIFDGNQTIGKLQSSTVSQGFEVTSGSTLTASEVGTGGWCMSTQQVDGVLNITGNYEQRVNNTPVLQGSGSVVVEGSYVLGNITRSTISVANFTASSTNIENGTATITGGCTADLGNVTGGNGQNLVVSNATLTHTGDNAATVAENLNVSLGNVTIAGVGYDFLGNVTLTGTITNTASTLGLQGTLSAASLDVFTLGEDVNFSNEETGNGYMTGSYLVVKGVNEGTTIAADSLTVGEQTYTLQKGENATIKMEGIGDGTYHINNDAVYGSDTDMTADATTAISLNDATLTINAGTTVSKTITASQTGTVALESGAELNKNQVSASTDAKVILAGEGTYVLNTNGLGTGVEMGENWNGVVRLSGVSENNINLAALAKGDSVIEMNGVTGWSAEWRGVNAQNIMLTNPEGGVAWSVGAYSQADDTCTFSGNWSGTGTFKTTGNPGGTRYINYTFSGDVSEWTGAFVKAGDSYTSTKLTFTGNATEVNASISDENNVGNLHLIADADTTFNNTVAVTDTTVNAGKTVTFDKQVTMTGGMSVGDGAVVSLNDVASMASLTVAGDSAALTIGAATTVTNAAELAVNALTMKEGATLSIGQHEDSLVSVQTLTVEGAATLNANLELAAAATLHMDGTLTMGCDVELGEGITLEGNLLASLLEGSTDSITLFTGVDALTLGGVEYSHALYGYEVFSNPELVNTDDKKYVVSYNGSDVKLTVVPEPATATLSLLALAALAARRRRH